MATVHNVLKGSTLLVRSMGIASGIGGEEEGVVRLSETLDPTIDLWSQPEWAYLRGERLAGGFATIASGAGTASEVLLYNPPGNMLVVVRRIRLMLTNVAARVNYTLFRGPTPPAGFVDINEGPLDTRDSLLISLKGAWARFMQAANAVGDGGLQFDFAQLALLVDEDDRDPIILAPGTGVVWGVNGTGVNTLTAGCRWTERLMLPSEQARA